MKSKLTVVLVVLLFALALFAQTATTSPKVDEKAAPGCACCKDMAKDGTAMDCCKGGDCCKDAKMCTRDKDGKMACCGDKCPMNKGDKTAKAGCCGDKCPMKNHGEHKGM